jgi:hypothetical protein
MMRAYAPLIAPSATDDGARTGPPKPMFDVCQSFPRHPPKQCNRDMEQRLQSKPNQDGTGPIAVLIETVWSAASPFNGSNVAAGQPESRRVGDDVKLSQ